MNFLKDIGYSIFNYFDSILMTHLTEGQTAPDFSANNEKGEVVSLSDFQGKKLALYFYPKDDTPGCTAQACDLRDNIDKVQAAGYTVLGVSPDTEKKHVKFIDKYDLPFSLLADTEKEVAKAYGVWGRKKFMGREYDGIHRTTFLIDEKGIITKVITKVKTKVHAAQILE